MEKSGLADHAVSDKHPAPHDDRKAERKALSQLNHVAEMLGIHIGAGNVRTQAERAAVAAQCDLPILLLGETGTGKDRFAHLIHKLSTRRDKELVAINCAAIPKEIAESYLFGHTKGAFTGAFSEKPGVFEDANYSTLFLDEVAELPLEQQAKLLRVIQDGVVQRLGSTTPRPVDARIIAATNRKLANEVAQGRFREDLYFRLETIQIQLPALRDRRNEIPDIALALLKQINQKSEVSCHLSDEALHRLQQFDWPGNIRQLINVLQRSILFAYSNILAADDLLMPEGALAEPRFVGLPQPTMGFSLERHLAEIRKQLFLHALEKCNNNQTKAAAILGMSKQAVSQFVAELSRRVDEESTALDYYV